MADETSQVVDVLDALVSHASGQITVSVSDAAKHGLERIRNALEVKDIRGLIESEKHDPLATPPTSLTDPEDLKYFNLYRESYSAEVVQVPGSQRSPNAAKAHSGGFKAAAKRAINATRFIAKSRNAAVNHELDEEMDKILSWDAFHVNKVSKLSDRQPLLLVGLTALTQFGLLQTFSIEQECAVNFLRAVEHHYLPNPYHNSTHAADVTQALLSLLYTDGLYAKFTDLELLALILSAVLHDVAHPGLSNPFLTKTQDEQALMYNDQSSNEALSLSVGFKILQSPYCNLFVNMSREDYFYLRRLMTGIVLGTDMAVHGQIVEAARCLHTPDPDADIWSEPAKAELRLIAMKTLMHVADISNAGRPPWLAGMWTRAIYEEFYKQGDAEREMGLEVSPLCDRDTVAIAESQKAFLNFVVTPTFDLIKDIAPKTHHMARSYIASNLDKWAALANTGDRTRVLNENDPRNPAQLVHVSPVHSPFHSNNHASWGSADMLLLLLNDENNAVIGEGIELLLAREREATESMEFTE